MIFIVVALLIDGLQAAFTLMFFTLGAGLTLIPFAGVAGIPVGVGLGMAVNICLSFGGGCFLAMLLGHEKMLYPKYFLPGGIAEIVPGFSLLPTWTTITVLSILQKKKDEIAHAATQAVMHPTRQSKINAQVAATPEVPQRPVDGIQAPVAANDNTRAALTQRYAA